MATLSSTLGSVGNYFQFNQVMPTLSCPGNRADGLHYLNPNNRHMLSVMDSRRAAFIRNTQYGTNPFALVPASFSHLSNWSGQLSSRIGYGSWGARSGQYLLNPLSTMLNDASAMHRASLQSSLYTANHAHFAAVNRAFANGDPNKWRVALGGDAWKLAGRNFVEQGTKPLAGMAGLSTTQNLHVASARVHSARERVKQAMQQARATGTPLANFKPENIQSRLDQIKADLKGADKATQTKLKAERAALQNLQKAQSSTVLRAHEKKVAQAKANNVKNAKSWAGRLWARVKNLFGNGGVKPSGAVKNTSMISKLWSGISKFTGRLLGNVMMAIPTSLMWLGSLLGMKDNKILHGIMNLPLLFGKESSAALKTGSLYDQSIATIRTLAGIGVAGAVGLLSMPALLGALGIATSGLAAWLAGGAIVFGLGAIGQGLMGMLIHPFRSNKIKTALKTGGNPNSSIAAQNIEQQLANIMGKPANSFSSTSTGQSPSNITQMPGQQKPPAQPQFQRAA